MKNYIFYMALVALLTACSDNLTDLNIDPKSYSTAQPGALFLAGEKALADTYGAAKAETAPFRVLSQIWTQYDYPYEAQYNLERNNSPLNWWKSLYTTSLINLKQSRVQYQKEVKDADVLRNNLAIIDILEVYNYYLLVNTYGDIPYTEAVTDNTPFPRYDDARTLTLDLIARLDKDIEALQQNYPQSLEVIGKSDRIYSGDALKWRKFANTLKLKAALLIADVEPQTAQTKALEAVSAGIFESNSDNANFLYDGATTTTSNPVWQLLGQASTVVVNIPTQFFINTLKAYNDPRISLYFKPLSDGSYKGGIAGETNSEQYSALSDYWLGKTLPVVLLDYAEAEFLLAEAVERGISVGGTAEDHYNRGIKASILQWGGTQAVADAYVANEPSIKYSASTNWREKIGLQKWIALSDRGWDAWTEIRRLGHPDIDLLSPPTGANGNLPQRLTYPSVEVTSNPDNYKSAVSRLSGQQDVQSGVLFWKK